MIFKRREKRSLRDTVVETVYPKGGWFRALSYILHRLRRLPDAPHRIARGIAAGIFVSFTPFFGLHLVIAAGLTWLMGGNILASLLATLVGNPVTFPFIMASSVWIGNHLLHQPHELGLKVLLNSFGGASAELWHNLRALVTGEPAHWHHLNWFFLHIFWPYTVGGMVPGIIGGAAAYYLTIPVITAYQKRRAKKLRERVARRQAMKAAARGREG